MINTNNILITESKVDAQLLQKVLSKDLLANVQIIEGNGSSSALSLARSFGIKENKRILLILNINSFDTNIIEEKLNYVKSFTSVSDIKIIEFLPELSSILFMDKTFIERIFDTKLSDLEWSLLQRDPQFAYSHFHPHTFQEMINKIDTNLVEIIQTNPKIKDIETFFK